MYIYGNVRNNAVLSLPQN